ncbi:MAG: hypothetical protein D6811_10045, partial [Alphaproteobacteria bacterium]
MRQAAISGLLLAALIGPASAGIAAAHAPETSLLPAARPAIATPAPAVVSTGRAITAPVVATSPRPRPRPDDALALKVASAVRVIPPRTGSAPVPDPADRAAVVLASSGAAVRL